MEKFTRKASPLKHQEVWVDHSKGTSIKVCDMDVDTLRDTLNFMIKRSREKQKHYLKRKYGIVICDATEEDLY